MPLPRLVGEFTRRSARWLSASLLATVVICTLLGCQSHTNPSFNVSPSEARQALNAMGEQPVPQQRPIVLVGGYVDPAGFGLGILRGRLEEVFEPEQLLVVPQGAFSDFDTLRDRLIARIDQAFGAGDDPSQTVEIDVIGFSMGGISARYAALPIDDRRRLNVRRLYTISSPHRGAAWAAGFSPDALVRDMRAGSAFMSRLGDTQPEANYEMTCYVRLGDLVVGPANAAPEGVPLWWVPGAAFTEPHMDAAKDPRIMADIARQLRGEPRLTSGVAAPLP